MGDYQPGEVASGAGKALYDGVLSVMTGVGISIKAALGNEQAQAEFKQGTSAIYEFIKSPENWKYLIGAMTPAQREQLAQAYEKGDATTVSKMFGESLLNVPLPTAAATAALKAGKAASTVEDLAKISKSVTKPVFNKIEDLFDKTFDEIPLSHTKGIQNGVLGEQLAIQLLNEKTGLNFKPLQNANNHGCDGCAVSIQGDKITVVVMDAKSSQGGVTKAASAAGDPETRLDGWLKQDWASGDTASAENKALTAAIKEALKDGAKVQGITVKVGVPIPGTTGTSTFKVEPWPKK